MAKCELGRNTADNLKELERIIKEGTITESDVFDFSTIIEDVDAELVVSNLIGEVAEESEIEQLIKDKYGEHWERYLLATKIVALSSANPIVADMIKEYIWQYIPTGKTKKGESIEVPLFGTGGLTTEAYNKLSKKKKLKQSLKVMSRDDLKVIYSKVYAWVTAGTGNNFGKGVIGNFMVQFFGGKQLGQKERSGAYFKFAQHITRYYTMIEHDIGNFMYKRTKNVKDSEGNIILKEFSGMNEIIKDIENLSHTVKNWKIPTTDYQLKEEKMVDFFTKYMWGEIFYDKKTKQFMAYENYGPVKIPMKGKEGLFPKFYAFKTHPDGNLAHEFQDPVPLSQFEGGRYDIPFNPTQASKFLKLSEQARKIDDRVYKHAKDRFVKSVEKVITALKKHFPDLSENEVKTLLFEEYKVIQHSNIVKKLKNLDKQHGTTYFNKYNKFKDTFSKYASIEFFLNQANESEYKKNHWPAKYSDQIFKIMWDNYIIDMEKLLKEEEETLATLTEEDSKAGPKAIEETKNNIKVLNQKIIRAKDIRDKKDGLYPTDTIANKELPLARDHKHLKSITNAFDVRNARKDKGVYYDYLQEIFSSINRNLLTATLLESIDLAESSAVVDALVNYYKVPFNDPTIEGGLGPIKWSDEKISAALKGLGMNVSPEKINRGFRRWNKWLTATFLGGTSTAWVNRLAIVQTMQDRNFHAITNALDYWKKNKENVDAYIAKSGVAAYQDFFSKSMINGLGGVDVDNFTAEQLYAIMLNYPATKEQLSQMSLSELKKLAKKNNIETEKLSKDGIINIIAENEMRLQFKKVLNNSPAYNLIPKKIYSKKEAKNRLNQVKWSKRDAALNRFVQYTLTQELDLNRFRNLIKWPYQKRQKIYKLGLEGLYTGAKAMGRLRKAIGMTMSDGEAWIRTVSFLVSVLQAQKLGYLKSDVDMWELTGTELAKAMEIGRLASVYSNMGLSATDVGATAWGGFGNYMQKFNYWALQKRGRDWRLGKNGIIVKQDVLNLGKNPFFDSKAVAKMLGSSIKNWPQVWNYNKMNVMQKQQAQLLKFMSIGVLPALVLDLVVWGPLGNIIGFNVLKFILKTTGGAGGIRGLPSPLAQLITIPLAFTIKMAFGMHGDDDDEEITRFTNQYLRTLPFGYGFTWPFENVSLLYLLMSENDDAAIEKLFEVMRPAFPTTDITKFFEYLTQQGYKAATD